MSTVWTEEAIRNEFKKLDVKTGLKGASLPISFNNSIHTLGTYYGYNQGSFRFSNHFFQDPDWPQEEALDVIRHEYAHYMDHITYGKFGHGMTWKKCCIEIGARPIRRYHSENADYHRRKHEKEERASSALDVYSVGSIIRHPVFGKGVIENISGDGIYRAASVSFEVGIKKLSLSWIHQNCRRCEE